MDPKRPSARNRYSALSSSWFSAAAAKALKEIAANLWQAPSHHSPSTATPPSRWPLGMSCVTAVTIFPRCAPRVGFSYRFARFSRLSESIDNASYGEMERSAAAMNPSAFINIAPDHTQEEKKHRQDSRPSFSLFASHSLGGRWWDAPCPL